MVMNAAAQGTPAWFRHLFQAAPGLYPVLEPGEYRIVAVTDA